MLDDEFQCVGIAILESLIMPREPLDDVKQRRCALRWGSCSMRLTSWMSHAGWMESDETLRYFGALIRVAPSSGRWYSTSNSSPRSETLSWAAGA